MQKVQTIDIELAIMRYFNFRQNLIVTNVTNISDIVAFETDVVVLSTSGYAHGIEIKVSKNDLKKEFEKKQHKLLNTMHNGDYGIKRFYSKFKYFSYAVPEALKDIALELIPDFCGLLVYVKPEIAVPLMMEIREPKKLYEYQWNDYERYQLARLGAMRIYTLKSKLNLQRNYEG